MFKHLAPHKLAAPLLQYLSTGITQNVDEVILGNVVGPGGNIARISSLEAGLPLSIPGMTIDRQCSAGLGGRELLYRGRSRKYKHFAISQKGAVFSNAYWRPGYGNRSRKCCKEVWFNQSGAR
jgi:hypothetical protein